MKKNVSKIGSLLLAVIMLFNICVFAVNAEETTEKERAQITLDFMKLMEDEELKALMEESIALAATVNPDRKTNPVQSLEEYYDFLDWSATCLPWNILNTVDIESIYSRIDQSLDYWYFLIDQPLPELAGKGYYYPCLEFHEPIASWVKDYCKSWGEYLSTEDSWCDEYYDIICNDGDFGMDKGWYGDENIWTTFNEWFARHLADENQRPISDADIVAPADSSPQGIWNIDENSQIDLGVQLKSVRFYNVEDIIGEDSEYETEFANGILTHTFLDVNDYHRYHFPVSGKVLEIRKISGFDAVGGLISWSEEEGRYLLWDENPGWQSIETRDCVILDTEYGLVAILPIGMSQVSSCNWEDTVVPGADVKAGDPMGYFLFGGSDIVMIFQDGVELDLTTEDHILMGEPYATVVK
ncbi:MAG: phosphatidylserine decarboxylase [Clostridia bacterium]|nr:phosphatidylserine decarboxylase [Clostridia bacterium]